MPLGSCEKACVSPSFRGERDVPATAEVRVRPQAGHVQRLARVLHEARGGGAVEELEVHAGQREPQVLGTIGLV